MSEKFFYFFILILLHLSVFSQSADDVIRHADEKLRGKSSNAIIIIKTIRPGWSREMSAKTWSKGNDMAMIYITSPIKDKGIVFLKRKKEVWNWQPTLERIIKLPPSMMSQSWMGTDFTNDDLVKESSIVDEYTHRFLADTVISGKGCYRIECTPNPTAAVVWGKLIIAVEKTEFLQLHIEFYDEDGILVNTMNAYDIALMGDRKIPTRMEMIPADKPGNKTIIIYKNIVFNQKLEDNFFVIEQMKKMN